MKWLKDAVQGLLTMAVLFTGMALCADAPNRIGLRFERAEIKESEQVKLTLSLDSPLAGNADFYVMFTADTAYFPTLPAITKVSMTTHEQSYSLTYITEGRFGSQEPRFLDAALVDPATYMNPNPGFALRPDADSARLKLIDAQTYATFETAQKSSTVTEGTDVYVRLMLGDSVAVNNRGSDAVFTAKLSGDGLVRTDTNPTPSDTSIITFTVRNNEMCSGWVKLHATIGSTFGQRSAYLKLDPFLKPDQNPELTVDVDPTPKAFQIVNHITDNPILGFALPAGTVTEPSSGELIYTLPVQSFNGIPSNGIKAFFKVSGTATETKQYEIMDPEFVFDGNHGSASIRIKILHDDLVRLDRTVIVTLYTTDVKASFSTCQSFTLTIKNVDRNTGVETGHAGFGGGVEVSTKVGNPIAMLIAVNGLTNGAVATATFKIGGGKYGIDYRVDGATKPGKNSVFTIATDSAGWAVFTVTPLNNRVPGEKDRKLTLTLQKVKSEVRKQKFKLVYKKAKITIIDDNPYVNPARFSMPHDEGKRYATYALVETAVRAGGYAEDSSYLFLDPTENTLVSGLGAEVTVQGSKTIIYNTNAETFRARVSDTVFKFGITDSFTAIVRKAGAGATAVEVTVCIGDAYTRNSSIAVPFSIVNAAAGNAMAAQVFSRTPTVYGYYYDPYQKIVPGKIQKPKKVSLRVDKITDEDNTVVTAKFTKRLRLYNTKEVKQARKIGKYTADVQSLVQVPNIGAEVWLKTKETLAATAKKGKVETQIAGMIMTPPRIDSVTYYKDKSKRTVMKVCGIHFGDKPIVRLEYRNAKGAIKYLKLKELKPSREKPIALVSLSGENDEFLTAPTAYYANTSAVIYFYLPEVKQLPSAVESRYDLYVESEIGLTGAARIGIRTGIDITMPWNTYFYTVDNIKFLERFINNISVVECYKDDGYQAKPLVVLAHGFTQSNTTASIREIAANLARNGYFVVMPNAVGHGDRINSAGLLATEIGMVFAEEIYQMLPAYRNDPRIDYARIGASGAAMGSTAVYALLGRYPGVFKAAVPFIGTPDVMDIVYGSPNQVWQYSNGDIRPSTPEQIARAAAYGRVNNSLDQWRNMTSVSLMMLNGANDTTVPGEGAYDLLNFLSPYNTTGLGLKFYNGAGHTINADMCQDQLLWFDLYLK